MCFKSGADESALFSLEPSFGHMNLHSRQSSGFSSARSTLNAEASGIDSCADELVERSVNGGGNGAENGFGMACSSEWAERTQGISSWSDRFTNFSVLMDTLVKGPLMMCNYARPHLVASRGAIINVASIDNMQAVRTSFVPINFN